MQIQIALADLEKRKAGLAEDLLNSLQPGNSSGILAQSEVRLEDGTILIAAAMSSPSDDSAVTFGHGNLSVQVPAATLQSLGALTVAIIGVIPRNSTLFSELNSSAGGVQSEILSLDLFANGTAVRDLMQPIQLTLPGLPTAGEPVVCGYFDEESNQWSTEGVSEVSSDGTLVCATNHLSIFGALLASIYAALACSNAAAIFSSEGLQNLVSRPSWMLEWSAILNWIMLFILLILLAMARRADSAHQEALSVVSVISSLKHSNHQSEQWEHFMDWLLALLPNPVEMVYSRMVKAHTGLTLKALQGLYQHWGHTILHEKAEIFLLEFEKKHLGRQASFWYQMNSVWFKIFQPSATASCLVRTAVLLGKIYSGWALSAMSGAELQFFAWLFGRSRV